MTRLNEGYPSSASERRARLRDREASIAGLKFARAGERPRTTVGRGGGRERERRTCGDVSDIYGPVEMPVRRATASDLCADAQRDARWLDSQRETDSVIPQKNRAVSEPLMRKSLLPPESPFWLGSQAIYGFRMCQRRFPSRPRWDGKTKIDTDTVLSHGATPQKRVAGPRNKSLRTEAHSCHYTRPPAKMPSIVFVFKVHLSRRVRGLIAGRATGAPHALCLSGVVEAQAQGCPPSSLQEAASL